MLTSCLRCARVRAMVKRKAGVQPTPKTSNCKSFSRPLTKPIVAPNLLATALVAHGAPNCGEAVYQELAKIIAEQKSGKLQLLAAELEVDIGSPDGWMQLALKLAERFVPGIQVEFGQDRGPGRPRGSGQVDRFKLFQEIQMLISKNNSTVIEACKILTKQSGRWKGMRPASLETRYHEHKRMFSSSENNLDPVWERLRHAGW